MNPPGNCFAMNLIRLTCAILSGAFLLAADSGNRVVTADEESVEFVKQVQPILARACLNCHGPQKQRGALRLDVREQVFKGGDSGQAAIKPGEPKASALLERVTSTEKSMRMPPEGERLTESEIDLLRRWIAQGARWPDVANIAPPRKAGPLVVTDADRKHWAFQPLHQDKPPAVSDESWCRTPIDRFVLARLDAAGIRPNAALDRRSLIRRVYFDLLGLPPTPDEVAAFVDDPAVDAYEKLVDRLLASPHYGERWGRHWLDLARYADSDGYEADFDRPTAYHYRDFVIKAFNDDLPFDTFVKWQLAGDEYRPNDPSARSATGFLTAGPVIIFTVAGEGTELERATNRFNELDDMLATTGSAFLGLTIGCARCHDHKFDPIPTRDYYSMLAAFTTSKRQEHFMMAPALVEEYQQHEKEWQKRVSQVQKELGDWLEREKAVHVDKLRQCKIDALKISAEEKAVLAKPVDKSDQHQQELLKKHGKSLSLTDDDFRKEFNDDQRSKWDALKNRVKDVQKEKPQAPPTALTLTDSGPLPTKTFLLLRGEPAHPGPEVELGFLSVLSSAQAKVRRPEGSTTTYQRTALAEWLTDDKDGAGALLARVIVNRMWQHHFGNGLVRTPNDFGFQGERPTHPELLDLLASDLIQNGWRLKALHRRIMTSAVYREDTAYDEKRAKIDPENRLLWRRRPLRLEAEILRDSILAVSGRLNRELFGPALKPPLPAEAMAGRNKDDAVPRPKEDGPALWRRSIYLFTKRSLPTPLLDTFDAPNPIGSCGRRNQSTVATQALALLNDSFVRDIASQLARRVAAEAGDDAADRVQRAFRITLGRPPTSGELERSTKFLATQDKAKALANFCQVLLTLNEFIYVD
jgi:mono/diheme cytochrome c family protein